MKKISKLLIGTNNKGKYKEIRDLLPKHIKTYSTTDFKLKSPRDDGLTCIENYIIKLHSWFYKNYIIQPIFPSHCKQSFHMYYLLLPN